MIRSGVKDFVFDGESLTILTSDYKVYRKPKIDSPEVKIDIDATDCTSMKLLDDGRLVLGIFRSGKIVVFMMCKSTIKNCDWLVANKSTLR